MTEQERQSVYDALLREKEEQERMLVGLQESLEAETYPAQQQFIQGEMLQAKRRLKACEQQVDLYAPPGTRKLTTPKTKEPAPAA